MHVHGKHFSDIIMAFIETDENNSPTVTRTEYKHLRELERGLKVDEGDQPNVAVLTADVRAHATGNSGGIISRESRVIGCYFRYRTS
jgi:hypothetical protein